MNDWDHHHHRLDNSYRCQKPPTTELETLHFHIVKHLLQVTSWVVVEVVVFGHLKMSGRVVTKCFIIASGALKSIQWSQMEWSSIALLVLRAIRCKWTVKINENSFQVHLPQLAWHEIFHILIFIFRMGQMTYDEWVFLQPWTDCKRKVTQQIIFAVPLKPSPPPLLPSVEISTTFLNRITGNSNCKYQMALIDFVMSGRTGSGMDVLVLSTVAWIVETCSVDLFLGKDNKKGITLKYSHDMAWS